MTKFAVKTHDGIDWRYIKSETRCTYQRSEAWTFDSFDDADRVADRFAYRHNVRARPIELEAA